VTKIIEIYIINPLANSSCSYFKVGINGVAEIRVDYIDTPFVSIVFEDESMECFCGMPHTYKTETPTEVPF
jgi:hypothetical protein